MAYYSEKLIHCIINFIFLKSIFLTEAITVYCANDHATRAWSLIPGAVCFDQWSENEDETIYLYFLNGSNHTLVLIYEASTFTYILKAYRGADNHSLFITGPVRFRFYFNTYLRVYEIRQLGFLCRRLLALNQMTPSSDNGITATNNLNL